jgi:hypothetical protein
MGRTTLLVHSSILSINFTIDEGNRVALLLTPSTFADILHFRRNDFAIAICVDDFALTSANFIDSKSLSTKEGFGLALIASSSCW